MRKQIKLSAQGCKQVAMPKFESVYLTPKSVFFQQYHTSEAFRLSTELLSVEFFAVISWNGCCTSQSTVTGAESL